MILAAVIVLIAAGAGGFYFFGDRFFNGPKVETTYNAELAEALEGTEFPTPAGLDFGADGPNCGKIAEIMHDRHYTLLNAKTGPNSVKCGFKTSRLALLQPDQQRFFGNIQYHVGGGDKAYDHAARTIARVQENRKEAPGREMGTIDEFPVGDDGMVLWYGGSDVTSSDGVTSKSETSYLHLVARSGDDVLEIGELQGSVMQDAHSSTQGVSKADLYREAVAIVQTLSGADAAEPRNTMPTLTQHPKLSALTNSPVSNAEEQDTPEATCAPFQAGAQAADLTAKKITRRGAHGHSCTFEADIDDARLELQITVTEQNYPGGAGAEQEMGDNLNTRLKRIAKDKDVQAADLLQLPLGEYGYALATRDTGINEHNRLYASYFSGDHLVDIDLEFSPYKGPLWSDERLITLLTTALS